MSITPDCFISYRAPIPGVAGSEQDQAFAKELHTRLREARLDVYLDQERLKPGYDWYAHIKQHVDAARIVLPILTPRWKQSPWTRFETYAAEYVIPLLIEGTWDEVSTPPLRGSQYARIDFTSDTDAAWTRLFAAIREQLATPVPVKTEDSPARARDPDRRLFCVPYQPNQYFVGRENELLAIHEALHPSPTPGLSQSTIIVITGAGGFGKTTIAREYCEAFWRCYRQVLWVDCRLDVESQFAVLFDTLFPGRGAALSPPEKARITRERLASDIQRLLILDNAQDHDQVRAWLPNSGRCRTIITSRYTRWSDLLNRRDIPVLEKGAARTFLLNRTGRAADGPEFHACDDLAAELGYLPLALEQAAAYMSQNTTYTFSRYLDFFRREAKALLHEHVKGYTHYERAVATTWAITIQRLSAPARAALRLCSFLADTPIPLSLFRSGVDVIKATAAEYAEAAQGPHDVGAEFYVNSIAADLACYSMANRDADTLRFHKLVQRVEREGQPDPGHTVLRRALAWVNGAFVGEPQDVRTWPVLEPLEAHANTVATYADERNIPGPAARLMNQLGLLLLTKSKHLAAEPLMRRALAIDEASYGTAHPNIAKVLNNLALLLQDTNRLADAEPMFRRALAIDEASYGTDHPSVVRDLNNLALLLQDTNRLADAEPMFRRALAINEASYGTDHPNIAKVLNNLALLLQDTNRLADAEPLMRRALAIDRASYGTDHPEVSTDLNNIAQLLMATNRLKEAEPLMRQALAIDEASYGTDHPKVATRLSNLAQLLQGSNRLQEAEPLYRRALAIDEASYGTDHPNVATGLNNLAGLLHATNRLQEAEPVIRRALAIDEASYGTDHPDVARDLNNLALLLAATNRLADAEPLMCRHLEIFLKFTAATGHPHPHLKAAANNYRDLLIKIGMSRGDAVGRVLALFAQHGVSPEVLRGSP